MATESNKASTATGAEWVLTRILNAPRPRVFKAWTDAAELEQWWRPKIVSNRCQLDLKTGGAYRIVMVMPDGGEYPIKGVYRQIVESTKLVMTGDVSSHPAHW